MESISTALKTQMEYPLRNLSYIKVNLGVVEPDAPNNNTASSTDNFELSDIDGIDDGAVPQKRYATMEHNRFILDGNQVLPPESGSSHIYYQGYISDSISLSDGTFTTNPVITIEFTNGNYFKFIGFTFDFDSILGCYISEMEIKAYYDTTLVYDVTKTPDAVEYLWEDTIPATGTCNKLEFIIKKTSIPNRRAIISSIMFGLVKMFTDEVITEANWKRNVDIVTAKLSTNSFSFTMIDLTKEYNPDNPTGFWEFIEKRQPVSWEYGYKLEDNSIEWISGGSLYTNGDISTSSEGSISKVTFNATSILNQLTEDYYNGVYNETPVSLYDLAIDVFEYANIPLLSDGSTPYSVDTALQSIYTTNPIPIIPINQALQLIANAGMAVLYTDRSGKVIIKQFTDVLQDFDLNFSNMTSTPTISKVPSLLEVDTKYTTLRVASAEESLVKVENLSFTIDGIGTECRITYEQASELRCTTTGTLVVVGTPTYYAQSCVMFLEGSGTLEIFGKKLLKTETGVFYNVTDVGYTCPIENSLLNSYTDAYNYAVWIGSMLTRRNQYTVDDRGYIHLDPLDNISVETLFSETLEATITGYELTYNGALKGKTEFLIKEGV